MHALQFSIRKFEDKDLDEVCGINDESFSNPWSREAVLNFQRTSPSEFLVAHDGKEVVGYAMIAVERRFRILSFRFALVGHLLNFAVKRRCRRQGIGRVLLGAVLDYLQREGAEEIFLEVNANNFAARAFYSRMGFEEIRLINNFYMDGDGVEMVQKI